MPLENIHDEDGRIWALWRITEDEAALEREVPPADAAPEAITNPLKRLEYMAGRLLVKRLLEAWKLPYHGLTKDEFGKPFLKDHAIHVSLSHSYPYVAAILNKHHATGIDLEQPKEKLLKIAGRVLNPSELQDAAHDMVKHCVYWCAKETLIKIYGKRDLVLAKDLAVTPFLLKKQGILTGNIIAPGSSAAIPLHYIVYDNFVVVHNQ